MAVRSSTWLAITGALARRGSVKARLLLGGALVYTAYSFAIYAFAVHFNQLKIPGAEQPEELGSSN